MARAILFLSLVGAALYGFLILTGDALTDTNSKTKRRPYSSSGHPFGRRTTELLGLLSTQPITKPKSATSLSTACYIILSGGEPTQPKLNSRSDSCARK